MNKLTYWLSISTLLYSNILSILVLSLNVIYKQKNDRNEGTLHEMIIKKLL